MVLIACGAFARKLVRGSTWERSDFYLGVELALSAIASAFVYLFDLSRVSSGTAEAATLSRRLAANGGFLTLCFFTLLWVLTTHQDWEKRTQNPKGQLFWLVFLSNLIGTLLMASFVLFVKGTQ